MPSMNLLETLLHYAFKVKLCRITGCCLMSSQKYRNYLVVGLSRTHAAPKTPHNIFLNDFHYTISYVLLKHYDKISYLTINFIVYNNLTHLL